MDMPKTVEIANGIFWVGGSGQDGGLHCNPYLIIDGDEAVLIDPGSVLDFDYVFENVCSLVPLGNIKYVILHHQDPDFCASVPLFEQKGAKFEIVTHWRTQTLIKYYGLKSDYYIVNNNEFKLVLKSGRVLGFVPTPYLHFAGAIATYDYTSKVLFSSDLFGAFSYEWNLYAQDDYLEKMKAFHEHYMPSNDIIKPVMEVFLGMDISLIAPQHGSIIKDSIAMYIKALRDLECGSFLLPIKRDLAKAGGYKFICSSVLKRYASIFNREAVLDVIEDMNITFEDDLEITDYNYTGNTLWNLIFEKVLIKKGIQWLFVIEPLVRTLAEEYDVMIPAVFETKLKKSEEEAANLSNENRALKDVNRRLESNLKEAENNLIRCPVTGLYNYVFFKNYYSHELQRVLSDKSGKNSGLLIISLDNSEKFRYSHSNSEVEARLRSTVYILESMKEENEIYFRFQNEVFASYIPNTTKQKAVAFAEKIRNAIAGSDKFIEKTTASIGLVCFDEIKEDNLLINSPEAVMYNVAKMRVSLAISMGMNIVCSHSSIDTYQDTAASILLVDTDEVNIDVLKTFLENLHYRVFTAKDGVEALELVEQRHLDLIISEIMIPKMDGFILREKVLSQSNIKSIPFVVLSYLKNEDSVQRAASLGIEHYFRKPFMLSELIGVIKNIIKGETYQ